MKSKLTSMFFFLFCCTHWDRWALRKFNGCEKFEFSKLSKSLRREWNVSNYINSCRVGIRRKNLRNENLRNLSKMAIFGMFTESLQNVATFGRSSVNINYFTHVCPNGCSRRVSKFFQVVPGLHIFRSFFLRPFFIAEFSTSFFPEISSKPYVAI